MLDGGNQVKEKSKIRLSGVKFDQKTDFRALFVKKHEFLGIFGF
jgi:hypothetical protein